MKKTAVMVLLVLMFTAVVIADTLTSSTPTITLTGTGQNVPVQVVEQLVNDYPDAVSIHITNWTPASATVVSTHEFVGPSAR